MGGACSAGSRPLQRGFRGASKATDAGMVFSDMATTKKTLAVSIALANGRESGATEATKSLRFWRKTILNLCRTGGKRGGAMCLAAGERQGEREMAHLSAKRSRL